MIDLSPILAFVVLDVFTNTATALPAARRHAREVEAAKKL